MEQSGDIGRMSALDAGYDMKASGVTLDRFCGSGITSANIAAASVKAGLEDLVVSGGTEMMSLPKKGMLPMGAGNAHLQELHLQSHQGVCADATATLEGIDRETLDALAVETQNRASSRDPGRALRQEPRPGVQPRRHARPRSGRVPRPGTTMESLATLAPSFPMVADYRHSDDAKTFRELINQKFPDLDIQHVHHAATVQVWSMDRPPFSGRARSTRRRTADAAGPHRGDGQHG